MYIYRCINYRILRLASDKTFSWRRWRFSNSLTSL
jgi:hypothetical protein